MRVSGLLALLYMLVAAETPVAAQAVLGQGSYIGGRSADWVTAMTRDREGHIFLVGRTFSDDFPLVNPLQAEMGQGVCRPAGSKFDQPCGEGFLVKLTADGSRIIFSTYLGGFAADRAEAVAVDADGNAYVAGTTQSFDFPVTRGTIPFARSNAPRAFLTKVNAAGTEIVYSRAFVVGSAAGGARGVAVSEDGTAAIVARVTAAGLGTPGSFASTLQLRPLWATEDGGESWTTPEGIDSSVVHSLVFDPGDPLTALAADGRGIYRSTDGARTWELVRESLPGESYLHVRFDPTRPAAAYAAGLAGAIRSSDSGRTWSPANEGLNLGTGRPSSIRSLDVDPVRGAVLAGTDVGIFRSDDGAITWTPSSLFRPGQPAPTIRFLERSPADPARVYACCGTAGLFVSSNGGDDWTEQSGRLGLIDGLAADPSDPNSAYAISNYSAPATGFGKLIRTRDQGLTWEAEAEIPGVGTAPLRDLRFHGVAGNTRLFVSSRADRAVFTRLNDESAWTRISGPWAVAGRWVAADPMEPSRWFFSTAGAPEGDAFITKIAPNGDVVYGTYLGGSGVDEPSVIAIDKDGDVIVVGATTSTDFPVVNAVQPEYSDPADPASQRDAFVSKISADGSELLYSTYLGGPGDDRARAVGLGPDGRVFVGGCTQRGAFPTTENAAQTASAGMLDGFVSALEPDGSLLYSTYLGSSGGDIVEAIAVDASGRAVAAGITGSADFPTEGAMQPSGAGSFFARLAPSGDRLQFSSYYGGVSIAGVAVDEAGSIHLAGSSTAKDPPLRNARQDLLPGLPGGFHARIDFGPFSPPPPGLPEIRSLNNAASFKPGHRLSPNGIHSIFGVGLASTDLSAPGFPLPATLGETEVRLDGQAVPLLFVSESQINFITRADADDRLGELTVVRDGRRSEPWRVRVGGATPGVFTWDGSGAGEAAALHASDFRPVNTEDAAAPGEIISVYLTGLGRTAEAVSAFEAAPNRAVSILGRSWAQFDHDPAEILYAGLAPGFVGLYQVNLLVPNIEPGLRVLRLEVDGYQAPAVWVAVRAAP